MASLTRNTKGRNTKGQYVFGKQSLKYRRGGRHELLNLIKCSRFRFVRAAVTATVCAVLAGGLKVMLHEGISIALTEDSLLEDAPFAEFATFLGLMLVFRANMSYRRYWEARSACERMSSNWYDAASALVAFANHSSKCDEEEKKTFKHVVARLFSVLNASALAHLREEEARQRHHWEGIPLKKEMMTFMLIDPKGLGRLLPELDGHPHRTLVVVQWVKVYVVEQILTGILTIPPPILSRVFQQLDLGTLQAAKAVRVARVPFPFRYSQACELIVILSCIGTVLVVHQWSSTPFVAGLFAFVATFIPTAVNDLAVIIERPFGLGSDDLDIAEMQDLMNSCLISLLGDGVSRPPSLVVRNESMLRDSDNLHLLRKTLLQTCDFNSSHRSSPSKAGTGSFSSKSAERQSAAATDNVQGGIISRETTSEGGGGLPLESPAEVEVQDPAPQSDNEKPSAVSDVVGV